MRFVLVVLLAVAPAGAQVIQTVVGNALNDNLGANSTTLVLPQGVAVDSQGNIYVADSGNFVIRKVDPRTGRASIVAGSGFISDVSLAAPGRSVSLDYPRGLAADESGNLYFTDFLRNRVLKLAPDGTVTLVAGAGECGDVADNARAATANLCSPYSVAADRAGNLFIGERARLFRVDPRTGLIRRIAGAGDGRAGFGGDGGPAVNAIFDDVASVVLDGQGNIYIADQRNQRIRRIDAETGIIRTVAGSGAEGFGGDGGPATSAQFSYPSALALDAAGNLLIADLYNSRVRRVDARSGIITTVAGGGPSSNSRRDNIPAIAARLELLLSVAVDSSGNIYIADMEASLVRRVDPATGLISTAVGTDNIGDGGPAISAPVFQPQGIALDSSGNLYIPDAPRNRVRRVDAVTQRISTVAGSGVGGFSGDGGRATDAALDHPSSVFVNAASELFIADSYNGRVRKVDRNGMISTVAGGGQGPAIGDGGAATAAQLSDPTGVVVNSAGVLFIADSGNARVRAVDAQGTITTVAGTGTPGFSGDGGPATAAALNRPAGLALDSGGNLLIADSETHTVRRVNLTSGIISTVAGQGNNCGYDDGTAAQARFCGPFKIAVDSQGNIYVADQGNHSVRRITAAGQVSTFAGTAIAGFSGDGNLAQRAQLNQPAGVAADATGNVFVADTGNAKVRKVTIAQQPSPALSVSPPSLSVTVPAGTQPTPQSLVITNINAGAMSWSAAAATTSGGNWLSIVPSSGTAAPSSTATVALNTSGLAAGTYRGTITVTVAGAAGSPAAIPVTMILGENAVARPGVSAQFLRFFAIQGEPAPPSQSLAITSPSSGTLNWAAAAATSDGGNWLSFTPASGAAPSTLSVSVAPANLAPGLYLAIISVRNTASSEVFPIAISLTVSAPASSLLPSQTTFVFNAVQGATALAPQILRIFNAGQGTMSWNIQSILPAGGNWLTVSPSSGSSAARTGNVTPVSIGVNPAGLSPGAYGAVLVISSAGAGNSPALVTVLMNVQRSGTPPVPVVEPAGMVFIAAGGGAAQQQTLNISSTGGSAMRFSVAARTPDGSAWLSVSLTSGQVSASGQAIPVTVIATPGQLQAGTRTGTISITPEGGTPLEVAVSLVITPGVGPSKGPPVSFACAPTRQVLTPQGRLTNNFALPVSWPVHLQASVTDDCGSEVNRATVIGSFTIDATTVVFNNLGNGQYSGSWTPRASASRAGVNLKSLAPPLPEVNLRLDGSLRADTAIPVLPPNAAVNGASFAKLTPDGPPAPLAAGSIFSLFGSNFAASAAGALSLPLPRSLGDVQLKIGGLDAPLFYVSPGQINAQVPWELAGRNSASVAVTVRGAVSGTDTITLAPQQPGIFSTAASGAGQGAILDAQFRLVDSANPVAAGDVIQIFATGLGPTTPTVASGVAAPGDPPATVNAAVQCRIGNLDAVVEFAGLAPGFVGLYQVNVRVPAGVAAGSAVSVVLTAGGAASNTVTIAVR